MRWPFRTRRARPVDTPVRIEQVSRCKPNQLKDKVGLPNAKDPEIFAAGDFTDIGLDGVDALTVPIARGFSSVAGMFQTALDSVQWRERAHRAGEGPPPLFLLMSEHAFRAQKAESRFRHILTHASTCRFEVVVVCSWLRPLDDTW